MRPEFLYRMLLLFYPHEFREEYGREMAFAFQDQLAEARESGSRFRQAAVWIRTLLDLATVAPKEYYHMIWQDIRFAFRTFVKNPSYAAVVVLSLALGIGANSAIFSIMNGVLLAELPVKDPGQLVILSNPEAAGVAIGGQAGERSLLTYEEFEQLRDHGSAFTGVMAAQSNPELWQARVDGREPQEIRGRMVSREYFKVLQVSPALGRAFDAPRESTVVLAHPFWRRHFNSDPGVLGKTIQIHKAMLTVVGVMPAEFFGETVGQQPDFWAPLDLQPQLLPGRDWMHDKSDEKVMWLHVFGRLKPGVSIAQAQESSNAAFHNLLEAQSGAVTRSPEARKIFLDQSIKARPAAAGASQARSQFNDPIRFLLAVVGVVLLIACANLANLLLARGAIRQREIALRLSLGAGRFRLIRQLLTESLLLAFLGGLAGLAVAYGLHAILVQMMTQADSDFRMAFSLNPRLIAFTFMLSLAAAILFGLLPAVNITRADVAVNLKEQGRGATGSAGRMRWGRFLVAAQIALSLPLLLGAGLLLRTLLNLQHVDLGYQKENILLLRIDSQTAGYDAPRQLTLFRDLLESIRKTPGVKSATFSENGLFSGRNSGDSVQVEGYTPKGNKDRGTSWDQVGPDYFTTLGVPLLQGRDINENDRVGGAQVCVINEAFAKVFFAGRNPIGMHVTTVYGDRKVTHEIVGVAKDHRTHRLRGETPHRNFVPITQPLGSTDGIIYEIRTSVPSANLVNALRRVVHSVDPNLPITNLQTLEEGLDSRMAQDRITARLSAGLGIAALLLAAIGLYGVLSYGVAWRRTEIGVRIALGAHPLSVIAMILRETGTLVVAGLVAGALLAAWAGKFLASQLYGLSPQDPVTFAVSITVLTAVALGAAFIPAWRASRVDPMVALRQD